MLKISAQIRDEKKASANTEAIPAVLYGPKIKNLNLKVAAKDFEKVYQQAGESSLVELLVEGKKNKFSVLIHEVQLDPLTGRPIHIDFYQPALGEEIETMVPLVFEGKSLVEQSLGGTLVKNISEIEVKALPKNLPKEIKINIESLKTFEDVIAVKDLKLPAGVKVLKNPEEVLVSVSEPEKVEEELEKPIEEKVEEVEKVKAGPLPEKEPPKEETQPRPKEETK